MMQIRCINRITKAEASNNGQMKSYTAAFLLQTDEEKCLLLLLLNFLVKAIAVRGSLMKAGGGWR
ncbi:unnamed protein product, partial [Heterosigma akashiwo]